MSAACSTGSVGITRPCPTAPQSGWTMIAVIGYATNARMTTKSARSTIRYVKNTTSTQIAMPASGTEMVDGTPKSPRLAAMPAYSAATFVPFATRRASIATIVQRTPNRSRMRSDRPFPVTAPIRAHISWMTIRPTVESTRSQSIAYP